MFGPGWVSVQDVSGSPFLHTTNVVRVCGGGPAFVSSPAGRAGQPRVFVYVPSRASGCLAECPWGRRCRPPSPVSLRGSMPVSVPRPAAASHLVCRGGGGLCSSASVSSVSGRVGARLCPSVPVNTRASVPAWCGRPASAGRCTQPTRARGFFGTDTLPPSAQMIQSPHPPAQSRELREPQGPPPGRSFSFLFPFLQPGPRGGLKVLAFRGGLKAGERGQLDWGPRAEEGCSQLVASRGLPGMAPGGLPELSLLGLKAWHIRNSPGAPI